MTAQGGDLLAWLETAITEREDAARLATQGVWRTHDTHLDLGGHTATVLVGERNDTELLAWLPTMSHAPWDEARNAWNNAEHIAANDPASVLRRCAADRKLIADHGPWSATDRSCKGCGFDNHEEPMVTDYSDCPVLNGIAEGYGWTEGKR